MGDRPDKRTRIEALHRVKAQQRATARAKLPLPNSQMQALFDMLDTELPRRGCNHALVLVRSWLSAQGLAFEAVEAWLHDNGGHCDCEALANAEQAWQDAIHDVNW
jgi:hypothetical protein